MWVDGLFFQTITDTYNEKIQYALYADYSLLPVYDFQPV